MRNPDHRWICMRSFAAALAGVCLLLYPCFATLHAQETVPQETGTGDVRRIAVLTHSFSSEYWGYVRQGCTAYDSSDPSVIIEVQEASSSIADDEQLEILETDLASQRYDGFVIAAINREKIEHALQDVSVPVVALNAPFDAGCVIGGTGTDNEIAAAAGAKKAAEMALDIGWEKPGCVMIGGSEGDINHQNRLKGYRRGIEDNGCVWLDAVYPTDKSDEGAREAMERIMEDYPDGIAIVACYNDLLAVNALEEAYSNPAFSNTVFLGFDGNGSICELIMTADKYRNMVTVAQNPYEMGFHAVEKLSQYLSGDEDSGPDAGSSEDDAAEGASSETMASMDGDAGTGKESVNWEDTGYSVITKVNAQERMLQIQSHLS